MAKKKELEERIRELEAQIQRASTESSYYPKVTLRGRIEAIEKHLGIRIGIQPERTIPAEIIVQELPKEEASSPKTRTKKAKKK